MLYGRHYIMLSPEDTLMVKAQQVPATRSLRGEWKKQASKQAVLHGVTPTATVIQDASDGTLYGLRTIAVGFLEEITSKLRPKAHYSQEKGNGVCVCIHACAQDKWTIPGRWNIKQFIKGVVIAQGKCSEMQH